MEIDKGVVKKFLFKCMYRNKDLEEEEKNPTILESKAGQETDGS